MRLTVFAVVLLLSSCAPTNTAPCETDADCETGVCRLGGCGPECLDALDCGGGEACVAGACVPSAQCASADDCAPGFACTGGQCRCTADTACARNEACLDGACRLRPPCTSNVDCAELGLRCDVAQGLCVSPCSAAADCAPGIDPTLAALLYLCTDGTCQQRCLNDATCGGDLTCRNGVCTGTCRARSDCGATEYCTSASGGSCEPYLPCADAGECPVGNLCEPFAAGACPPGVDCAQPVCQPLPACRFDADCTRPAFCEERHCRPSTVCDPEACPEGRQCVAHVCVPAACRGHADCPDSGTCSDGVCVAAAAAEDVVELRAWPRRLVLEVGDSRGLTVHGVRANGATVPVSGLSWTVVDGAGEPSTAATIDAANRVLAVSAGTVRVRATLAGSPAAAAEVTVHGVSAAGVDRRKVVVVDDGSGAPLAGVSVSLCDAAVLDAPCAAPIVATTGADGVADFASTGTAVSVTAASPELRADGLPRYDAVSVLAATGRTLLVPLGENAVAVAAGATGTFDFGQAQGEGTWSLGLMAISSGAPWELSAGTLLGETYQQSVPGLGAQVPLPAGAVASADVGFGFPFAIKGTADAVTTPGARMATGFAGHFELADVATFGPAAIASRVAAMDYAIAPPFTTTHLALVPDAQDRDGDGRCEDAAACPGGTELLPDFASFPALSFTPSREQRLRTEVILAAPPAPFDAALVSALQATPGRGLAVLGLGVPAPDPTNAAALAPLGLRSGAPYGGAEFGQPALAAVAYSEVTPDGSRSVRFLRGDVVPTRAVFPDFLPVAGGTTTDRSFAPQQPEWNATASAGAGLARLTFTGTASRHVVYFGVQGAQTSVFVPPADGFVDPLGAAFSTAVTLIALPADVSAEAVFDLAGPNLASPTQWVDAAAIHTP